MQKINALQDQRQSLGFIYRLSLYRIWTMKFLLVPGHYRFFDLSSGDIGKLKNWCIEALVGKSPYSPPDPPPQELPAQAQINNISGKKQALPLDCEARVAVDWAKYFGKNIDELTFQNRLPKSVNPDLGFVGNVNGSWGQIPPNAYGIHAGPVVDLLRTYGVSAYGHRPLDWEQLKAEIAASRPVIVWVAGSANRNEYPHLLHINGWAPDNCCPLRAHCNGCWLFSNLCNNFRWWNSN